VARASAPRLLATSDLHVDLSANRALVDGLRPEHPDDWLLVAGDVSHRAADLEATLAMLAARFAKVVWAPGNHDLWTRPDDELQLRGEARYRHLVDACGRHGVVTPEDPYPIWDAGDTQLTIVPLLLLYDYSFRPPGSSKEEALARAYAARVVCADELLLHPDPYGSREEWCRARLETTLARLAELPALPTVLVSHYPLRRDALARLRWPEFTLWCGTTATEDWHLRFRARAVVYGHLHIPSSRRQDGVRFEEVSLGYPREWRRRSVAGPPALVRDVLAPAEPAAAAAS
jgi:3',5'-cyclic AMP phosphodiesterase CpdA